MNDRCETCGHDYDEHDGMGDCEHPDGRTATGFCEKHRAAPTTPEGQNNG